MTNERFNPGDKVVFVPENSRWTECESNPRGRSGVVSGSVDGFWIDVEWSNGLLNAYQLKDNDLEYANDEDVGK